MKTIKEGLLMSDQEYLELGRLLIDFPLPYIAVQELHITESANEHSMLTLQMISAQQLSSEEILRYEDTPIKLYMPDGGCVYAGICTEIGFSSLNQYTQISITAKSFSYRADIKSHNRTFQNPSKYLSQVVDAVLAPYGFIVSLQEDIQIRIMLSQQEETDWAFVRRIVNQFGFTIFVDSKSSGKRISIGVVPFSKKSFFSEDHPFVLSKDIAAFWRTKNGPAAKASVYEFLQQGYQVSNLDIGVGYAISGGISPQIVVKSDICAISSLLINSIVLAYQDGAYPATEKSRIVGHVISESDNIPVAMPQPNSVSSIISGKVIAISGTDIQVEFSDGQEGGVRWIPYCSMLGNDFYCMTDEGDTVYCYYETNGEIACLGSRHVSIESPDFKKPDEKVMTANNCMIRQKPDSIELTGNRREMEGKGGERVKITFSDTDGIDISSSQTVTIKTEGALLIQSTDLEKTEENPTEWFDSQRIKQMGRFDAQQAAGVTRYTIDKGNMPDYSEWKFVKNELVSQIWEGIKYEVIQPFQLVSTIGSIFSPKSKDESNKTPEQKVVFEQVKEYQVMIMGLNTCSIKTNQSSVEFSGDTAMFSGPDFWFLGFNRSSDYPVEAKSPQTLMDTIMDSVQVVVDLIGIIPGCNIVCGVINAGISLVRGQYYNAVSSIVGMFCPGGGLVLHTMGKMKNVSKAGKGFKLVKGLTILKMGAVGLNGILTSGQMAVELFSNRKNLTGQECLELINSIGRGIVTALQSAKGIDRVLKDTKIPQGNKEKSNDDDDSNNKSKVTTENEGEGNTHKEKNQLCEKDPIDVVTGSQKMVQTDFAVKDIVDTFLLRRTYQSVYKNERGLLGSKWYLNVESWIFLEGDKAIAILPDMHLEHFTKKEDRWENDRSQDCSIQLDESKEGYCLKLAQEKKQYFYNQQGHLIRITDRNRNSTWLRYAKGTLMEILFSSGQFLKFHYEDNKVSRIEDILGRSVCYRYDGDFLTEVEYPNHGVFHYTYTPEGYLMQATDPNGHTYVHNYYDMNGRVTRQTLSNGQEYIILYDDDNRVNTFLTPQSGERIEYHYNKDKLLTKIRYTDGTCKEMAYDTHQNKNYIKDRMGGEVHNSFDVYGNLLEETLPNGLVTQFVYDENGNLIRQSDNAGRVQEMAYDSRGNKILVRIAIDKEQWQETAYTYDMCGRIICVKDPRGNQVEITYRENEGSMASFVTAEGSKVRYSYDEAGRCMSVTDEMGQTTYAYNSMDYAAWEIDALGNTTKYFYDMLCNITKVVLPNQYDEKTGNGAGTRYIYDAMDEIIQQIDPLGNVYITQRDLEENVLKEVHPNCYDEKTGDGAGICYEYDTENRRIKVRYPDGGVERILYDANGNIIKMIHPEQYDEKMDDGLGYTYQYDCVNRLVQITDPEGVVQRHYIYDLCGNIMKSFDAVGYNSADTDEERIGTLYQYNAIGWLTQKRVPIKQEQGKIFYQLTMYQYDTAGNMVKELRYRDFQDETSTDGPIHILSFAYDKDNRRIQVSDNIGAMAKYQYNCRNQCTREERKLTKERTQVILYQYDAAGRMTCSLSSVGEPDKTEGFATVRYEYDKNGNCTCIHLPEGGEVIREYDAADQLTAETHIDKKSGIDNRIEFTYDKIGNLIKITDNQGQNTTIEYDLMDREIRRIEKDGSVTRQFYDKNGRVSKFVRPNQYCIQTDDGMGYQYTYDLQGRILSITGPDGSVLQRNTYDQAGRILEQTDAVKSGVKYAYNLAGDRISFRSTGGATQELEYDAYGNIIGVVDGNKNYTQYELDDWGRIIGIIKPDHSIEHYTYNYAGDIESTIDGEGNTTHYIYDLAGNLSAITDPMGQVERYVYDKEGNLSQKTDRNGIITQYAFNIYGAPLYQREKGSSQGNSYQYTPEGLLKAAISDRMQYSYEYDIMGRLKKKSASGRTLLSYQYDLNGNMVSQEDVTGKVTEYTYNMLDLMQTVTDNGAIVAEYTYYPDSTVKSLHNGSLHTEYTYDADKNISSLKTMLGTDVIVENYYDYDHNGNRTAKRQTGGDTRYTYDALNQLTKVEYPAYTEQLYYDRAGNRKRRVAKGIEELYQYDARNRLTGYTKGGIKTKFTYDNAGNLLTDDRARYTYDAFNRTKKVETYFSPHTQVNHYDAEGLRSEMIEDGKLVQFIFRGDEVAAEEKDSNIVRFIRGYDLVASDAEKAKTYYHYACDEMGSITHLVEEDSVKNCYEYDAWGNLAVCEETVENRFKYNGQQLDPITWQYYLRARFYSPVIARFTQEDTYRGDGLNLYVYCRNNPVYYVDPSGNVCWKDYFDKFRKKYPASSQKNQSAISDADIYRLAHMAEIQDIFFSPNEFNKLNIREKYRLAQRLERLNKTDTTNEIYLNMSYKDARKAGLTVIQAKKISEGVDPFKNANKPIATTKNKGAIYRYMSYDNARKAGLTVAQAIALSTGENPFQYPVGTGRYGKVKGHHVLIKSAFRGNPLYTDNDGFSLSEVYMQQFGINHNDKKHPPSISGKQMDLYRDYNGPNIMSAHQSIAINSLIEGGAPPEFANAIVNFALVDMYSKGVTGPTRMPWK